MNRSGDFYQMAHCIQALVARLDVATAFCTRHSNASVLSLPQGFGIVPVERETIEAWTGKAVPQESETFFNLTAEFMTFLKKESAFGRLAYIETEYFGDIGCEGATVLDRETVVMAPVWEHDSILTALRHLGVQPLNDKEMFRFANEYSVLGFGHLRSNERIEAAIEAAR